MATTSPAGGGGKSATLSPAPFATAAAATLTRDEATVAAPPDLALALAAAIDCSAPPLARVADAVVALSCEAARWDATAAFNGVPASKDHADVAADVKKLLLGSSNLARGGATSALAPFAQVPPFHGIFRAQARAFHAEARTRLSAPAKSESGSTGDAEQALMPLVLLARHLVWSAHSMCTLSLDRARLCTGNIADADLQEKLASGGINAKDLKAMLDSVKDDSDVMSVLRGVYDYLLKFREVLAWEAAVAMTVIEMDSSIQKPHPGEENKAGSSTESKKKMSGNGTLYALTNDAADGKGDVPCVGSALVTDCSTELPPPQAGREKAKGDIKSTKKKTLGKGTSSVLMLLRDHATDGKNVPCVDSALVTDWGTKLSLLFDPRCPELESLVQKVKVAVESSEARRRLPKIPKGTRDFGRDKMPIRRRAFSIIRDVFKMHGGVELDTPVFELRETLMGKYGEDSKLIYDLADQGGELCSLRYDLTVPFARYLAMNNISSLRRYQIDKVYRRDNPSKGRYREFYQCDFDIAGVYEPMEPDFEVIKVLIELLDKLDIGKYEIKLNHRKLLDGMLDICGVPPEKFRTVCSSIDKLDKLTFEEVKKELVEEKGVSSETAEKIGNLVNTRGPAQEVLLELRKEGSQFMENDGSVVALNELEILFKALEEAKAIDRISFDLSLARGLDYYTGVIYEAVFKGATQVGSIAAGGRYDNLVGSIIAGKKVPAVGVSLGIERVLEIMEQHAKEKDQAILATETEVLLSILGKDLALAAKLASELWSAGIKTEFKLRTRVMDHISYAKDSGIPWMVLVGEKEMRDGNVKLKDIRANREEEVPREDFVHVLKQRLGN